MEGDTIKKFLKNDSEKLIIIENGKPKFVVMSYAQYSKLTKENSGDENFEMNFEELFSRTDPDKENITISEDKKIAEESRSEQVNDISLEDLPVM